MKIRGSLVLLALSVSEIMYAQTIPNVTIKTPEVSAFNRNIEIPVSYYTGLPNISIPLYEVQIKDVTVPITLNYHAGGIRVDQEATWVGLGWSLSYGGEISRKVRGVEDEKYFIKAGSYTNSASNINYYRQLPNISQEPYLNSRSSYLTTAKYKNSDYMPDEFYYSVLGYSGKFMFSQEKNKFILFPKEDIQVNYDLQDASPNNILQSWTLKLPNGNSVLFGESAVTKTKNSNYFLTNSWRVKSIQNTDNESINFSYTDFSYDSYRITDQSWTEATMGDPIISNNTSITRTYYSDCRPTEITFPQGKVIFSVISRSDLPASALSEILVTDNNNVVVKRIAFNYDYFIGNSYDVTGNFGLLASAVADDYKFKRLRLSSLTISGSTGNESQVYNFDYYTSPQMPSKFSFAQDHFGFYNGKANTGGYSFIPHYLPHRFTGGDRRVAPTNSNVFSLKSIQYPEGGKTEFVYENNKAGIFGIPSWVLNTYQDDNIPEKSVNMYISSYGRLSSYPSPDATQGNTRFFYKEFAIDNPTCLYPGYDWSCSTNFGISSLEENMPATANNAKFLLEKLQNGSWTKVAEFNTHPDDNTFISSDNKVIKISSGSYRLAVALTYTGAQYSAAENQPYNLNFYVRWRELNQLTQSVYVGGLRVKEINYYSAQNTLARKKEYTYIDRYGPPSVPEYTSGRVVSIPFYYQDKMKWIEVNGLPTKVFLSTLSSQSVQPLETTGGSYCGYEYVTELDIDVINPSNKFKTLYRYSFNRPYFSEYYPALHLGNWEPKEWTRGKLLTKEVYKGDNIIAKEDYTYYDWSPHLADLTNEDYVEEINTDYISLQYINRISYGDKYGTPPDFIDYDPNLGSLGAAASSFGWHYGADSYNQTGTPPPYNGPTYGWPKITLPYFLHYTGFDKLKSKTSTVYDENNGSVVQAENFYYEKTPNLSGVTKVESVNSKGHTLKTEFKYPYDLSATGTYSTMLQRHILSPVIEQKQTNATLNKELFKSKINYQFWQGNSLIKPGSIEKSVEGNTLQTEANINAYDSKGNILQITGKDGVITSYIYGYNSQYPVAKISGSDHATASTYITQSVLDAAIGNGDDVSIRNHLANLRNIPGAFVTTYTYKPLVGITSETDPRGKTIYYEYDASNRLSLIRDQDNNIIKKICYNYAGQVENCGGVNATPAWQSTGQIRCKPCPSNTAYTTNMQQHEERDNNANSPSYNTTRWVDDNVAGSCAASPAWQNTGTPVCETSGGNNTGNVLQQQTDMNPCSPTYNQTQTVTTYNSTQCPPPAGCTTSTCTGDDKKCINGVCETGVWSVISSIRMSRGSTQWSCTYAYCFSDGTFSTYRQTVTSSSSCFIECL